MIYSVVDTKAFVTHFPLIFTAFDVTVVLQGASQVIQWLASLLIPVLLPWWVHLEVHLSLVVAVGVVVLQGVQLLLVEAQVLGVLPSGSFADEATVELLTHHIREFLKLASLLHPVSSDSLKD